MRSELLRDELFGRLLDDLLPEELGRDGDALGVDGFEYEAFGVDGREYEAFGVDGREYEAFGVDGRVYEGFGVDGREYEAFGVDRRTASCPDLSEFSSRASCCDRVVEGLTGDGLRGDGRAVEGFTLDGLTVEGRAESLFRLVEAVPVRSRKVIGARFSLDVVVAGRTVSLPRTRRSLALKSLEDATLSGLPELG